jgi:hypothetical protein
MGWNWEGIGWRNWTSKVGVGAGADAEMEMGTVVGAMGSIGTSVSMAMG